MHASVVVLALMVFVGALAATVLNEEVSASRAGTDLARAQSVLASVGTVRQVLEAGHSLPPGSTPLADVPMPPWFAMRTDTQYTLVRQGVHTYLVARYESPGDALRVRAAADRLTPGVALAVQGNQLRRNDATSPSLPAPTGLTARDVVLKIDGN